MKAIHWMLLVAGSLLVAACGKKETEGVSGVLEFKLQGAPLMIVDLGTEFKDPGVKVIYWGEDKSSEVKVSGELNTNKVGFYKLTYTFLNRDKLPTQTTRDIIVADPKVKIDLSGKYTVQDGTNRSYNGGVQAYSGYPVSITRIAPGFFFVSDLFAGYYEFYRNRKTARQRMEGYVELKSDNSLVLHDSNVPQWNSSLDGMTDGLYKPEASEITYQATWLDGEMRFTVMLKKNL